jgi:RNA polymerase sigma-70 factor (ECF subfamily)
MPGDAGKAQRHFTEYMLLQRAALEARALRLCGNADEARDLVQDTFERAWKLTGSFAPELPPRAWLMTVLTNLFLDRVRHQRVAAEVPLADNDKALDEPPAGVSAEEALAALQQLPAELREVVELHDLRGMRYREIAERLAIPLGTVGTRLVRARLLLRQILEPKEPR